MFLIPLLMSNLSHKQELFKHYLIKKLGFNEDFFLAKYISILEMTIQKFKFLGRQNKVWNDTEHKYVPENENLYNSYVEKDNYFIPVRFNIIDLLNVEVGIKKGNDYTSKEIQLKFISATDIANFTYCPVSFSISKTFDLPKLETAILGSSQHEKHLLINYLRPFTVTKFVTNDDDFMKPVEVEEILSFNTFLNDDNQFFFDDLSNSSIVFYGHDKEKGKRKYFRSPKGNFVGQPDYLFQNQTTSEIFVVEEKFQFVPKDHGTSYENYYSQEEEQKLIKKRTSNFFFANHINQLSSYIYGIADYEIKYGYLVYWKYELKNGDANIIACKVLKIDRTADGLEQIREVFISLRNLIATRQGKFDINLRNPAKCAGCVSNLLCGHKTGKFSSFELPYSKNYLKLYFAPFPEELKKKDESADTDSMPSSPSFDNPI